MRASARSVAVIRALPGLGDFLCAVPALRALRDALPDASISLVALPSTAPLAARFSRYIDETLRFPGFPGIPETPEDPEALGHFVRSVRQRPFDLAVQMHGNGSAINGFLDAFGAEAVLGYRLPCAAPREGLLPYRQGLPEVRRWTRLVETLGITAEERLEFPLTAEGRTEAAELLARLEVTGPYACVHPGAAADERRWDAEGFARAAEHLAERGLNVVLTGSPSEAATCGAVAQAAGGTSVADASGATSLDGLAALIAGARAVLCNDTGVSHLAQAVRAPSVVVFTGASDPARWAPLDSHTHRAVLPHGLTGFAAEDDRRRARTYGDVPLPEPCGGLPCPVLGERPRRPGRVDAAAVLAEIDALFEAHPASGRSYVA